MFKRIYDSWYLFRANLRLKHAIQKAEKAHRKNGERFYVMPDDRDRLIIMRRKGMRRLRRYGLMDNRVRVRDLVKESFYFTPNRAGEGLADGQKEAKRLMYLEYVMHNRY